MKDKITVYLFVGFLMLVPTISILSKDEKISYTERRELATFPKFELTNEYVTKLDKYFLDHFPKRDSFRSLKANYNYHVMQKLDNNGIYLKDNYIFKTMYPTNKDSINNFIKNINSIKSMVNEENNIYFLPVPDKNYYLKDNLFLQLDYDYIYDKLNGLDLPIIDIRDIMTLDDYYQTDTHWKQEQLDKVVKKLCDSMNLPYQEQIYKQNSYDKFHGVYYGESAMNLKPEKLTYLTNNIINETEVKYLENPKLHNVYNLDNLNSFDSYEVYLDGASSFIEIMNSNCNNKKELVIFRDSFGSSLTPLLIPYYSKITLIDNRYINSENFLKYINFENQDVLFLYSTLLINNSYSLKG